MAEIEGQVKDEELDPEQQARRRLALAQIRQYPDAALKMAARPVEEFDDDLRRLVERMKQLMVDANGIGLAATQVGVLQRLFVFQVSEDETVALANPEIVERERGDDSRGRGLPLDPGRPPPGRAAGDDRDRGPERARSRGSVRARGAVLRASPSTRPTTSTAS